MSVVMEKEVQAMEEEKYMDIVEEEKKVVMRKVDEMKAGASKVLEGLVMMAALSATAKEVVEQ